MEHIFDLVSKRIDTEDEVERLITMTQEEKIIKNGEDYVRDYYYTLFEFVGKYTFKMWKHRDHCISISDYLEVLDYYEIEEEAITNTESLLLVIELMYNFWMQAFVYIETHDYYEGVNNFYHLKTVMDDLVEKHNYKVELYDDNTMVKVVPNKPGVDGVVEMLPDKLSFDTVMYNHSSLKGDIAGKKKILVELGRELEAHRDKLEKENSDLEDDIFCLLNNLDLRHNNTSEKDKKQFKIVVANMNEMEIEKWYDELYEMMLLGFLTVKNIDRKEKVKELRSKM